MRLLDYGFQGRGTVTWPDWAPADGAVGTLSLNTLNDVADGHHKVVQIWTAWSGVWYVPWYGVKGSFVSGGGGHGSGNDNGLFRLDLNTRLWTKLFAGPTWYLKPDASSFTVGDEVTGWMWGDVDGLTLQVGQPWTAHFYANMPVLPPNFFGVDDGAPYGYIVSCGRYAVPESASYGTAQGHKLRIGVDTTWTLLGDAFGAQPGTAPSFIDTDSRKAWIMSNGNSNTKYTVDLDSGTAASVALTGGSPVIFAPNAIADYSPSLGLGMVIRLKATGTIDFWLIDTAAGAKYNPGTTGSTPPGLGTVSGVGDREYAARWSEDLMAWVCYGGDGGQDIYFLKAPASNPTTTAWTWSTQELTGTITPNESTQSNFPYNRIAHLDQFPSATRALIAWLPEYDSAVQVFNVARP